MKRIGIYGGSFDPPHVGHIQAAQYACEVLDLDTLLVIPACVPPHKQTSVVSASPDQRLKMLQMCFSGQEKVQVSDLELRRGGVSYTYETVEQLRQEYPNAELILLMGTDMFASFKTWRHPDRILKNASLAVLHRGEQNEDAVIDRQKTALGAMATPIYTVENPVTAISSTNLRRMLAFGCGDAFLLPPVSAYIRANGMYGIDGDLRGLSMEALEKTVISLLKPDRVNHVLGCRDTAVRLAQLWGENTRDAARAALLHDITKALDGPLQLTLCKSYGIILDNFSIQNPKTLHALTGSLVAQRIFGENEAVVSAICSHTTGKADMNTLEKIIYVADYMEPNRNFDGVEELRRLAFSDLDGALKMGLEMTIAVLQREGREISPASCEALAWLAKKG